MSDQIETDRLVKTYLKIRNAKRDAADVFKLADADFKLKLETIENELLRRAQELGVDGFTTAYGTTYKAEDMSASIQDGEAFTQFLATANDPFAFYEQRVSLTRIREYRAEHNGETPPGIKLYREIKMRVRAKKGAKDDA